MSTQHALRTFRGVVPPAEADTRTAALALGMRSGLTSAQIEQRGADAMTGHSLSPRAPQLTRGPVATLCLEKNPARPTVTVVICAYTEQRWEGLVQTVASVQRQTEPPDEILLVIDYCPGLLQRATQELPGVTVIANRYEKGLSGARNTGLSFATCDVVAFIDDDAVAAPNWIAALLVPYVNPQAEGLSKTVVSRLAGANWALASNHGRHHDRHHCESSSEPPRSTTPPITDVAQNSARDHRAQGYAAGTVQTLRGDAKHVSVGRRLARVGPLAGLPIALALWLRSLPLVELDRIGDYGLIPLLPLTFWVALAVLLVSFSVLVRRATTATPLLVAHILTLIAILHATPCLLYGTLRYSWAWKHVGLVDYFLRHNGVDTSIKELSAYQFWPGFFNVNAMLDKASGLETSLNYAGWAPPFFNVLLIGPLFLIFRTFTGDRRLVWSAIMIFFLGSWVGQDYFAPQACVYFLYLTVVALCLRYLGRHSDVPGRHRRLVVGLAIIPMLAAIVPTHQLTPLLVVCALGVLAVFCRQRVWLLTLLMIGFTAGWDLMFAGPWITSNRTGIGTSIGALGANASSAFINLAAASHSQAVVAQIDRTHSAVLWILAFAGFARRFRVRSELALPLLAVAPFPMVLFNDYGGEIIFRVYLFGLPFAAFYAAAAFFPRGPSERPGGRHARRRTVPEARLALPIVLLLLVPGFVAGYYGKEQANYSSPQEISATRFMYGIAPRGSVIIGTGSDYPLEFINFEFYDYLRFAAWEPQDRQAILDDPVGMFSDMMATERHHHAYLLLSRNQAAWAEMTGALPPGALARIEQALSHSPRFTVIYRNPSAMVITLTQPAPEEGAA